jgi:hypothetical protein
LERIWPLDKYVFSLDAGLEFLNNNLYNIEETSKKIKDLSPDFEVFLTGNYYIKILLLFIIEKKLGKDVYKSNLDLIFKNGGKVSKRIHLK